MKEGATKDLLLDANGGIDIFEDEIDFVKDEQGQSHPISYFTNGKFFSLRNEKVPSAHLWKSKDGIWYLKDFGEQKGMDAISFYAKQHGIDGKTAFIEIAQKFRKTHPDAYGKSSFRTEPHKKGDVKGNIDATTRDFTERDLRIFGRYVTKETLQFYNWEAVDEMRIVRDNDVMIKKSEPGRPIFRRKCYFISTEEENKGATDFFYKYYEPRAEKRYRFRHFPNGKKPDDYVHGLWEVEKYFKSKDEKLRYIIIASGEHDSMNLASFCEFNSELQKYENPYKVIWLNSETAKINENLLWKLRKMAQQIVNVPDIDTTGIEMGNRFAMENIDILQMRLPSWIMSIKDDRGNPCKDLSDYVELGADQKDIAAAISNSCKFRFWQINVKTDKAGNEELVCSLDKMNVVFALNVMGYRHKINAGVDEYFYEKGHIIHRRTTNQIQAELVQFLSWRINEHNMKTVLNTIVSTNQFTNWCKFLDEPREDVDIREKFRQRFYFQNCWIEVNNTSVNRYNYLSLDSDILADRIRPIEFMGYKPVMDFKWNEETNDVDVTIVRPDVTLLQYMMVTSMIYWQEDMNNRRKNGQDIKSQIDLPIDVNSQFINNEQANEQMLSFFNKIFIMGYMMSSYKDPSKPWIVYLMDNALGEGTESNGGSGKSLFNLFANILKNDFSINGKQQDISKNNHLYGGVTRQHDFITFDDLDKTFRVEMLFNDATGDLYVNPKGKDSFTIPKEVSPKLRITTNYVPIVLDASSKRRLLMGTWSSYFHVMTSSNGFEETFTPRNLWGKNLITDFSSDEMSDTISCLIDCLRYFYICSEHDMVKECIIRNIEMKQLRLQVGGEFLDWFTMYFNPEEGHCNMEIAKKEAYLSYRSTSDKPIGQNMFSRKIKQFCKLNPGYEYNPDEICNAPGRIIRKYGTETTEYIYVKYNKD